MLREWRKCWRSREGAGGVQVVLGAGQGAVVVVNVQGMQGVLGSGQDSGGMEEVLGEWRRFKKKVEKVQRDCKRGIGWVKVLWGCLGSGGSAGGVKEVQGELRMSRGSGGGDCGRGRVQGDWRKCRGRGGCVGECRWCLGVGQCALGVEEVLRQWRRYRVSALGQGKVQGEWRRCLGARLVAGRVEEVLGK